LQNKDLTALQAELRAIDVWNDAYLNSGSRTRSDEVCYRLRNWRRREILQQIVGIRVSMGTRPEAVQGRVGDTRGRETILLVDDEPALVEVISCMLQSVGYKVLEASTGDEALHIARHYKDEIHLLLSDIVLRGSLRGPDLETELRKARSGLKCLLMSGYSQYVDCEEREVLEKPFDRGALLAQVRQALDRSND
jgi:CheY-like chemotaxis protein